MNIHLPAILMWTTGVQGFDTLPFIKSTFGWFGATPIINPWSKGSVAETSFSEVYFRAKTAHEDAESGWVTMEGHHFRIGREM